MEHSKNLSLEDIEGEIWKDVVGYESIYKVSNFSRVKSLERKITIKNIYYGGNTFHTNIREKILKQTIRTDGYLSVRLSKKGNSINCFCHRLVADSFIPNPEKKPFVNHKNGIRNDNMIENLEWCNNSENVIHSYNILNRKRSFLGKFGKYHNSSKKVIQFDLNGNEIKTWYSVVDIERELGFNQAAISHCCNGKTKTSNGFIWKYVK